MLSLKLLGGLASLLLVDTNNTFTAAAGDTLAYDITQTNQATYTNGTQAGGNPNGPFNQLGSTLVCE